MLKITYLCTLAFLLFLFNDCTNDLILNGNPNLNIMLVIIISFKAVRWSFHSKVRHDLAFAKLSIEELTLYYEWAKHLCNFTPLSAGQTAWFSPQIYIYVLFDSRNKLFLLDSHWGGHCISFSAYHVHLFQIALGWWTKKN